MELVSREDIAELDIHSYTTDQAKAIIVQEVKTAPASVKAILVIHGYSGEAKLLNVTRKEVSHSRILKIQPSRNPGSTYIFLKPNTFPVLSKAGKVKKLTRKARKIKAEKLKKQRKEEKIALKKQLKKQSKENKKMKK